MPTKLTVEQKAELQKLKLSLDQLEEAFTILNDSGNEVPGKVQGRMKHTLIINTLYKIVGVV